ncbi:DUF1573 domain-containing protein [Pedobacter gandavensis]|uniref:DUF1573 domain-containing protein n=1 Tax=Pedobacter gandavensis TaxID=2679963 RepID=UPI00292DEA21|nr:DUF1573 domain-containing protein [Pedobacter gandavensis]
MKLYFSKFFLLNKSSILLESALLFSLIACVGCSSAEKPDTPSIYVLKHESKVEGENLSKLEIDNPVYNFGTLKTGEEIRHVFLLTNKSKTPLIIKNANTTCGCTVALIPKKPIFFNQQDSIVAVFSSNTTGMQNKVITVFSNSADSIKLLTLVGNVVARN